jgi:protein involved in sex pheromone biosynthesis
MKKLIIMLIVIVLLLSGCVSKTNDTNDNNKTGIGKNDGGGGSDTVEKIVTDVNTNVVIVGLVTNADRKFWK